MRDYARRRVSERNRRKAALSAEITQEGETGWADGVFLLHAGRKDFFAPLSLSAGAVDDLADLPFAETELSRRTVVAAVEP